MNFAIENNAFIFHRTVAVNYLHVVAVVVVAVAAVITAAVAASTSCAPLLRCDFGQLSWPTSERLSLQQVSARVVVGKLFPLGLSC